MGSITPTATIPVIDISSGAEEDVAHDLVQAAIEHGFVYIKNQGHAIPVEAIDETFELSKSFFASSIEEKETCKIKEDNKGWSGMHTETLDAKNQRVGDFKEAFNIGPFTDNNQPSQPLPPSLLPHAPALSAFQTHCHDLCLRLLRLFAIGLQITTPPATIHSSMDPTYFSRAHLPTAGLSGSILRLLFYPSLPSTANYLPDIDIRAGAHSDYGSITLLFQRPGQPGLEIFTANGEWVPVPVQPAGTENDKGLPVLVNIGDLLNYWTEGLLRSTVHKVVFPVDGGGVEGEGGGEGRIAKDRYSIAYFCHPAGKTKLEAVPSEMVKKRAAKEVNGGAKGERKVMTADEHLQGRLKATYLDLYKDEEAK